MELTEITPEAIRLRPSHQGRNVLVTGAARGIGRAIAQAFVERSATVGICDPEPRRCRAHLRGTERRGRAARCRWPATSRIMTRWSRPSARPGWSSTPSSTMPASRPSMTASP